MLASRHVMAFLATSNAERSKAFYAEQLGLPLISDDQFALVFSAGPTVLRIQKVEQFNPAPFTALGWVVPNIAEEIAELLARGVVFERYPFLEQDDFGVWSAPSGAKIAWFKDPEGNVLSLTQSE